MGFKEGAEYVTWAVAVLCFIASLSWLYTWQTGSGGVDAVYNWLVTLVVGLLLLGLAVALGK